MGREGPSFTYFHMLPCDLFGTTAHRFRGRQAVVGIGVEQFLCYYGGP